MEIIVEKAKVFDLMIGEQKYDKNIKYRLMKYVFLHAEKGKYFIYNNLTKELIRISEYEYCIVSNNIFDVDSYFIKELIKKWFYVPYNFKENKLCDQLRTITKQLGNHNEINTFDIFTTTYCNARCFYCFEAEAKKINMDIKIADDVADYIIKKNRGHNVIIQWFGGEPLCNHKVITQISKKLQENNIQFSSRMTTNAYLFNEELIKIAKDNWNLDRVQITLDGLENTYNKVKNYVSVKYNPFHHVIENINLLLKNEIIVRVRLNMDNYNSNELFKLVDYLYKRFGKNRLFSVYAKRIFENKGFYKSVRTDEANIELNKSFINLCNKIKDLGLNGKTLLNNQIVISQCMADNFNTAMILPDGKLGYCEHHTDDDIYGDIYKDEKKGHWSEYISPEKKCLDCLAYPSCLRLKKCDTISARCDDIMQNASINTIKNSIYYTYEQFFKKRNTEDGSNQLKKSDI